jgi:hypothetical protein
MRLCTSHTLAVFAYSILGLLVYFLLVRFMCRFLAIGTQSDEVKSLLRRRSATASNGEPANRGAARDIPPLLVGLRNPLELGVDREITVLSGEMR